MQNEQEDLRTKLEGKFDRVADGDEIEGTTKKKKAKKKDKPTDPPQVKDSEKERTYGSKKWDGAAKRKVEALARQKEDEKTSAALKSKEKKSYNKIKYLTVLSSIYMKTWKYTAQYPRHIV